MPKTLKKIGGASIESSKPQKILKIDVRNINKFIEFNFDAVSHNIYGPITEWLPFLFNNIYNNTDNTSNGAPAFMLIQESTDKFAHSTQITINSSDTNLIRTAYQIELNQDECDFFTHTFFGYGDIRIEYENIELLSNGSLIRCEMQVFHRTIGTLLVTYTGIIMVNDPTGRNNFKNIITFIRNNPRLTIENSYIWGCCSIKYNNEKNKYDKSNNYPQYIMPPSVVSLSDNITLVMRSDSGEHEHNQRNILCVDMRIGRIKYTIANTHSSFERIQIFANNSRKIGKAILKNEGRIYDNNIPVSFNLPYYIDDQLNVTNYVCPTQRRLAENFDESNGNILDYAISNRCISAYSYVTSYGQEPGTRVESDHSAIQFDNITHTGNNCNRVRSRNFNISEEILECEDLTAGFNDFLILNTREKNIPKNHTCITPVKYGLFLCSTLMYSTSNDSRRCFIFGDFNSKPVLDEEAGDEYSNAAYFYTLIVKKHVDYYSYYTIKQSDWLIPI
jgi:hypothetical protein